ncbi:MAG: hypothetical protein AB7S69_06120 [Salinivirgaceae bacterium]|jgi:hypothetical protein
MEVYKTSTVTVAIEENTKVMTQKWNGYSSSQVFREAIDKSLDAVKKHGVKAILNDTLDQAVVKPEDSQYAASVMPKLFMSGLKAMAIVLPKSVFTQMSIKKFQEDTKGANIKLFTSTTDASEWIENNI